MKHYKCFNNRILIRNVFEQKICILGSCDTEDGSNDYENTALITGIHYGLKEIQTENSYFKL